MADQIGFLTVVDAFGEKRKVGGVTDDDGVLYLTRTLKPGTLVASPAVVEGHRVFSLEPRSVYSITATGLSADAWLLLFDAIAPPDDGAVAPVAAVRTQSLTIVQISFGGALAAFANGVVAVLSSSGPFTKTSGPTGFLSALMA